MTTTSFGVSVLLVANNKSNLERKTGGGAVGTLVVDNHLIYVLLTASPESLPL